MRQKHPPAPSRKPPLDGAKKEKNRLNASATKESKALIFKETPSRKPPLDETKKKNQIECQRSNQKQAIRKKTAMLSQNAEALLFSFLLPFIFVSLAFSVVLFPRLLLCGFRRFGAHLGAVFFRGKAGFLFDKGIEIGAGVKMGDLHDLLQG